MILLIFGITLLIGIHLLPMFTLLRTYLVRHLGMMFYQALFSLIALTGLVLIIIGMSRSAFYPLWSPASWANSATVVLMFPALVLLVAAYLPSNIKYYTGHPMLWSVVLWSIGHLLANGDLASLILFGSLGVYALVDMRSANIRGASKQTSHVSIGKDLTVVLVGALLYAVLLYSHPHIFGVSVI